ncbi:MAG: DUF3786 domain-containing protein [Butyricicoccus sp.]|nr:DUF3786 domain-containing protein [Butyricicoccus sp.]
MEIKRQGRPSNYDIMRDRMELEFVRYDQGAMLRKFGLKSDAGYIYLRFAGRDYRIHRATGRAEWYCPARREYIHADYGASMTIFDMLAWSRPDCALDGRFVPPGALGGMVQSSASSGIGIFSGQAAFFAGRCDELRWACLELGGRPADAAGDVSAMLPLFDFFPVMLQFWDADEEFGAVLKFMWDKNTTDFIHYETVAFATGHLIERLKECMEESAAGKT